MFESWWFRFLHFGVHSSSAQQERRRLRRRRQRRRWRCKWLGGGSSGCSARSTHRFPRSLHHILPDNSSPTAFGDRCCAGGGARRGPLTVRAPATPPLAPSAAFPRWAEIAGARRCTSPVPSAGPPQPTTRFWGSISELAPLLLRSTLHSSKHQLSLARFSLQICGAPVFDPPLLQCSASARPPASSLSLHPSFSF